MRKLFSTIPVVLALLVSAVFTVQKVMAAGTASWVCITGGAMLSWNQTPGNPWTITTPTQTLNGITNASGTWSLADGDGKYRYVHAADGIDVSLTCPIPTTTTPVVVPPPPFWANEPKGAQRIDADPGEQMAIYCYPGGYVDIWDTSGKQTKEFATTTYFALAKIAPGTTGTLTNDLTGGTFTASVDITGKFVTAISSDGKYSKTFSLDRCLTWVNYKEDPKVNYPLVPSYTVKTSAVITNQLDAAKKRLASAVGATAIALAQADVVRWEALYRSNNTVITENANGTITFQFSDGTVITI